MQDSWPYIRPWTDHLVMSSFVLIQPAFLWCLAGYEWVGLLLTMSALLSALYHRYGERASVISFFDITFAVTTLLVTLVVYWADVVERSTLGMEWHLPVIFVGMLCLALYAMSHHAYEKFNVKAYDNIHLAWHVAVIIGQCLLASAVYDAKI